jgi:transcription elongation factor Elf1
MKVELTTRPATIFDCPRCCQEVLLRGVTQEQVANMPQVVCHGCGAVFGVGTPEPSEAVGEPAGASEGAVAPHCHEGCPD